MKTHIFNIALLLSIIILTATIFATANAQGSKQSKEKWIECANASILKYAAKIKQNPVAFETEFCAHLKVPVGEECDAMVELMAPSGQLKEELDSFTLNNVVEPVCGNFPGE